MELEPSHHSIADTIRDALTYADVTVQLGAASLSMLRLSRAARGAFTYVEGCAKQVDNLADTAAGLGVDTAVTSAHHDAATIMRGVLEDAESLANEAAEMSTDFHAAKDEHEADYGPVHEAMTTKPGAVADRTYYSNR